MVVLPLESLGPFHQVQHGLVAVLTAQDLEAVNDLGLYGAGLHSLGVCINRTSSAVRHHQQSDIISQTAVLTAMGHKSNASQDALCLKTSVTKHLKKVANKVATCGSITCALVPAMCTQAGICLDGSLAAHITWLYQCNVERKKRKRKYYAFRHRLKKSPRMRYIGLPCSAR
jgi:hypothetical protein